MAIERMKTVWLFAPHGRAREVLDRLAAIGLGHVCDTGAAGFPEAEALGIGRVYPEAADLEQRVQALRDIYQTFAAFHHTSREFLANFISTPVEVKRDEVCEALRGLDVPALHARTKDLERQYNALVAARDKAREEVKELAPLAGLDVALPGGKDQRRAVALLGTMPESQARRLTEGGRLPESCACSVVATLNRRVVVQVACPAAEREAVLALFRECQFRRLEPDEDTVRLPEYVARRREKARRLQEQAGEAGESLRQLAAGGLRQVEMALGYWEERLNIAATAGLLAESKRLTILKCYVRAEDLAAFQDRVASGLPGVALRVADPRPGETPPVSLRNPRFLAPAQFLVSMFGLPDYFALDPTPVIFFSFLVFFGFCFGDVIYGVGLIALGLVLARKYREYTNLRHFFVLLTWAGIPTIVVGALTGSWAGDLPKYLGEGNPVQRLSDALKIADPVVNAVQVLALALVIGMVNQWVGIVMGMVRNLRQGDVKAAIYDGVFWLLLLPGFALVITGIFVPLPAVVRYAALAGMAVGAVGLALTQGRGEKTLLGKALIGLVSLYGVVGTYGVTAFVGDTLSYCRLLALGLTTGIVAVCFNMIADLSRKLPVVGIVLCLVVLIAGHLLNFFLSILGGFVHSARLTFVEFFGRFYQGGAPRFAPLGCWRGRIRVTDSDRVWTD